MVRNFLTLQVTISIWRRTVVYGVIYLIVYEHEIEENKIFMTVKIELWRWNSGGGGGGGKILKKIFKKGEKVLNKHTWRE
jgi:hypothetical protein